MSLKWLETGSPRIPIFEKTGLQRGAPNPQFCLMTDTITILDDEPDRLHAMVPLLRERLPDVDIVTFDNAPGINAWLAEHLPSCVLICLDHDLILIGGRDNKYEDSKVIDPGTGRDVADFLATRDPVCQVIIHTTNTLARPGMIAALEDAGWEVSYVSPYEDLLWIQEVWADAVSDVFA